MVTRVAASRVRNTLRVSDAFARPMRPAASASIVAPRSKVILSLLLIVGAIPGWGQNGTGSPQLPPWDPTVPMGTQQTEDRPVSWKLLLPNILQDQKPIWTFPAAGEAVADAEILTTVMKHFGRRLRPSDIPPYGDFDDTWFRAHETLSGGQASFPSGHTIAAFAVAAVFADRYRNHRWVPWVAYGLAGLVGFSRITLSAHFPSDVFAGATFGYLINHYIVLRNP